MGYTQATFAVLLLLIVIARNHFRIHLYTLLTPPACAPSSAAAAASNPSPQRPNHHIATFLPPSAAASFASTCASIRFITGTQYLSPLRTSAVEALTLLELYTIDLTTNSTTLPPAQLLCLYCRRLVPYPALCGDTSTRYCKVLSAQYRAYVPSKFCPQLFHTAMTLYRHGHSPNPLISSIMSRCRNTTRLPNGTTRQEAWEYRFISGSLYQRARWTFILPRRDQNYTLQAQPCSHFETYKSRMDREVVAMQVLARNKSGMRAVYSEMVSCQHCRAVLRVGCRKFRGLGLGLFVTWWVNLGHALGVGEKEGRGWKDVKYSRQWLMDYFDSLCHSEQCFDFEGLDTRRDRRELLAAARNGIEE